MSRHVPPFFCPYCGEQDIRPYSEDAGGWRCGDCQRAFLLRSAPTADAPAGTDTPVTTGVPS